MLSVFKFIQETLISDSKKFYFPKALLLFSTLKFMNKAEKQI